MEEKISSICPCKECTTETGRCVGCHGTCKPYIQWNKHQKDCKRAVKEKRDLHNAVSEIHEHRVRVQKHYKKQK